MRCMEGKTVERIVLRDGEGRTRYKIREEIREKKNISEKN